MDVEKLKKLNKLVSLSFKRKHTIVLDPEEKDNYNKEIEENIVYDAREWNLPDELSTYVDELSKDETTNIEDKILMIFEKVCTDYVYDDNLISYIKKVDDETFTLPDWYGRDIDDEWEKNREEHNRRICYELSRYISKSLTELLKDNKDYNICIHWNKDLTHYLVGLTSDEYSVTLDCDDFFNIKDLTRLKAGLTAKGINILEDKTNKFRNAVDKFNEGRSEHAIKKMEEEVEENEDIAFLKKSIEILAKKYNLDSQGIFEYMKEIVDIRLGSERREKIWKKIDGDTKESTRFIRCLIVDVENQKYLIDVDEREMHLFSEEELETKRPSFIPYNDLSRGGFDYYDGR